MENAEEAYSEALKYAEVLLDLDATHAVRRQRGVAITLYSLARVLNNRDSEAALTHLNRALNLMRSVIALEPTNARRPRDLGLILALRGEVLLNTGEVQTGIDNCREAATFLLTRAVESPQELKSQQDLEDTIIQILDALELAQQRVVSNEILTSTIDQLQCIAGAEELAGRTEWSEILSRLQDRSDAIAVVQ